MSHEGSWDNPEASIILDKRRRRRIEKDGARYSHVTDGNENVHDNTTHRDSVLNVSSGRIFSKLVVNSYSLYHCSDYTNISMANDL